LLQLQTRGFWPFVVRLDNLPDVMRLKIVNVLTILICAEEFYEYDEGTRRIVRRSRAPKSLVPHLTVIVDDFLAAYHDGPHSHSYAQAHAPVERVRQHNL
jgi:hypothetical protein